MNPMNQNIEIYPRPTKDEFTTPNSQFKNGDALPELTLHFTAIGQPDRGKTSKVQNAVLISNYSPLSTTRSNAPALERSWVCIPTLERGNEMGRLNGSTHLFPAIWQQHLTTLLEESQI